MLEVRWRDPAGRMRHMPALLEDISPSGACLQLESAVPTGVEIRWDWPSQHFIGRVRYCTYREVGYFVGVEFSAPTKWSKQAYSPRHLLELQALLDVEQGVSAFQPFGGSHSWSGGVDGTSKSSSGS
jgi:hypothetical protein